MTATDEIKQQLTALGHAEVVGPRREFVEALGQQLDSISIVDYATPAPVAVPARRRPQRLVFVPAFGVFALIVGLLLVRTTDGSSAYALSSPFNVHVQLADGKVVDATEGMKVPRGATVIVGAGGSVRIGNEVYSEGALVLIGDDGPHRTGSLGVGLPTTRAELTTTTAPVESTKPSTTVATTKIEPTPTTKLDPLATLPAPPPTRAIDSTTTTAKPVETTRPPTTTLPPPVAMQLTGARVDVTSQVSLSWTAVDGTVKYVLIRTTATGGAVPPEPSGYPVVTPSTLVVMTTARTYIDTADVPVTSVRYRVVALDGSGRVIGSSTLIQVDLPR